MTRKPNIRSIRFSDELAELIERQAGNTFTEKFEGLIIRCVQELPEKEKELAQIQKQIQKERKRLYNLQQAVRQLHQLELSIKSAQLSLNVVERQAKDFAEAAKKDGP